MGLRRALSRRRAVTAELSADPRLADPVPAPAAPAASPPPDALVVGAAERRQPAIEVPDFFTPSPATAPRSAPSLESPELVSPELVSPELVSPELVSPELVSAGTETRPYDRALVRAAWDRVSQRADQLVANFYAELYAGLGTAALDMFPASMTKQREDFGRALVQWVVTDDPESMSAHLDQLGADHRKFKVEPHHYEIAGQALVNAWSRLAGPDWTPDVEQAVVGSYTRLASAMIDGALRSRDEPAFWGATVIGHERVVADFAVLTVQPDAPYVYQPGQYLTVEVANHPKLWRRMSVASAPRPDNTFDLHVRSIGSSGVSAALVAHTELGDRLRIGAPRGNDLVVEPGTLGPGGLLCVCSGVGAAPVTAVIESILSWPQCPAVYAYLGVRSGADLYSVDLLNRLAYKCGRDQQVTVEAVAADDPAYAGHRGRVEEIVPGLRNWAELGVDALVAGPDAMIATTVVRLTDQGMPIERIHFDQYDIA